MTGGATRTITGRPCALVLATAGVLGAAYALGVVRAQAPDAHAHTPSSVPSDLLERPLTLRDGRGVVHESVSTASPQAQSFYDQGLAYLHSYIWIEAARSFHQ